MNVVLESKLNRQSSQGDLNQTSNLVFSDGFKNLLSSPEAQIGNAMKPATHHYKLNAPFRPNKRNPKQKTIVLNLNLADSNSSKQF